MDQEPHSPQRRLQIDTSHAQVPFKEISITTATPTQEKFEFGEKDAYLHLDSQLDDLPYSPNSLGSQPRHDTRNKSHEGLLRLIGSFLGELRRRPAPPSVFDAWIYEQPFKSDRNARVLAATLKGVAAFQAGRRDTNQKTVTVQDDSDEDEEKDKQGFSTDITAAILVRLRASLLELDANGWQLDSRVPGSDFGSSSDKSRSPFRSRRRSLRPIGRRSRSPSPATGVDVRTQDILSDCLTLLSSIISEDCRFQAPTPGPARPPNALQSVTLDVILVLCKMYRYDPQVLSRIGTALMPAFATFKAEMHSRLLSVFNDWIVQDMLDDLRRIQGADSSFSEDVTDAGHDMSRAPSVSIRVEVHDEEQGQESAWVPWTKPGQSAKNIQSTNSPSQSLSIYFLSSLVQPLVSAIGENIMEVAPASTLFNLYRVITTVAGLKRDACLDVLNIVAYSPPRARHFALSLLTTMWPGAIGHLSVSRSFPIMTYRESVENRNVQGRPHHHHSYSHQFTAWNFITSSSMPAESSAACICRACSQLMQGFGLLCPFCTCAVHFDCYDYPEGSHLSEYTLPGSSNRQKVAVYRFCHLLPTKAEDSEGIIRAKGHKFQLVNIFTLCLCFVCRKPLWGCSAQGLRCSHCHLFAHRYCIPTQSMSEAPACRDAVTDASYISLNWVDMRDSFNDYYRHTLSLVDSTSALAYEELSILHGVLWMQLQILDNGLMMGSVVVNRRNGVPSLANMKQSELEEFEIHSATRTLESLLFSTNPATSPALGEYLAANRVTPSEHSLLYDWSTLTYISSLVKASDDNISPSHTSLGLLSVAEPEAADAARTTYQTISLARMRDALARGFSVYSDAAARHFLRHIHQLAFFERTDRSEILFRDFEDPCLVECSFTLPFGLDESPDVEHLVAAIEVCLLDLDLSVNEAGLLLLTRRLWPNELTSDYARTRMCSSVVTWILTEDESLASILRDYVAHSRPIPGIRSRLEMQSWPSGQGLRHTPPTSTNNGGDYVACRRALLHHYGARWLLALHNLDMDVYAATLYDICDEFSHKDLAGDALSADDASSDLSAQLLRHDNCLRHLIKLGQASVAFAIMDDLIRLWLERLTAQYQPRKPLPTVLRLFNREAEGTHRYSSVGDPSGMAARALANLDPWRIVTSTAGQKERYWQSLHWLLFLASAGVDVAVETYQQFASYAFKYNASLDHADLLVNGALASTWLRSLGHQRLQNVMASLHSHFAKEVIECIQKGTNMGLTCSFIRRSLSVCLLLFGCERQVIVSSGMIEEEEIQCLPSRRKLSTRATALHDPIIVDANLISCLRKYVDCAVEEVSIIVAKFLNMLVNDAALLESYEVDNLILKNEEALCACAWRFFDLQSHVLANIRTGFLLRLLVVDTQSFRAILHDVFERPSSWEMRFQAVTCLFRMIMDVTSPIFNVEGRQFKSSFIDVFYYYFRSMWADEKEEIRLTIDTWSKSLLPAHFEAMAACWTEALPKIPVGQRLDLVSFLVQLHPHFPEWQVLSWDVIVEMILEDDYLQKNGDNEDGPASAHLSMYGLSSRDSATSSTDVDPEMTLLRVSVVLLSLQMIANGVPIDIIPLLRIKTQLLNILGFSHISAIPSLSGNVFYVQFGDLGKVADSALPCIAEFPALFDAFHPFELAPSAVGGPFFQDETPAPLLIGSIFIDVLLALINKQDLSRTPGSTAKRLLEALLIVIYKHDFDSRPLKHFGPDLRQAVRRAMDVMLLDVAHELRQLALSVCSAYIKCWGSTSSIAISESIETAAKAMKLLNYNTEDALVGQLRSFIETALATRVWSGIFTAMCRRPLEPEFFITLTHLDKNAKSTQVDLSLREALLRDTLGRAADNDRRHIQQVVNNLNHYVEMVHHEDCSPELLSFVGQQLASITKRMAEVPEMFDPGPLFLLVSTLIENNISRSHELLRSLDVVLRSCLIRFNISGESLMRLARVSLSIWGRPQPLGPRPGEGHSGNIIVGTMLDCLSDGLRGKARVTSSTLTGLLEIVSSPDAYDGRPGSRIFSDFVINLAEDSLWYLSSALTPAVYSDADFASARAAARFILRTMEHNADVFLKQVDSSSEKSARQALTVRSWNVLLITALSTDLRTSPRLLLEHFPAFLLVYHRLLRIYVSDSGTLGLTGADINYAYIAMKLWLLLARKVHLVDRETGDAEETPGTMEDVVSRRLWNDLWPPFEHLLTAFEVDTQIGSIPATGALILTSVADLFMFLHQSRSVVALDIALHVEVLNRVRALTRNESTQSKVSRVLRTMTEPAEDVPWEVLVKQVMADMVATEKLQALEARKRDAGKVTYEKGRREGRGTG
ncbi:hypothetical protein OE88DRAFT_1674178 [Heliocybe sulcata]|uniref:Phorbol-ester/DAG-type domain-containing protein n=1 Tax=Heliocybe sulcata TaxID=5364 RepID=A0A5C3NC22_9AGAM|nr:hypothetical protein OE88DRAFT_1674178 [Heliocybe sulcata]